MVLLDPENRDKTVKRKMMKGEGMIVGGRERRRARRQEPSLVLRERPAQLSPWVAVVVWIALAVAGAVRH